MPEMTRLLLKARKIVFSTYLIEFVNAMESFV